MFVAVNNSLVAVNGSLNAIAAFEDRDPDTPAVRPWASAGEIVTKKPKSATCMAAARHPCISLPNNQDDSRELLQDLFPGGFTSSVLSPTEGGAHFDQQRVLDLAPTGASNEHEPELQGSHTWACLVPTTPTCEGQAPCGVANVLHQPSVPASSAAACLEPSLAQRELQAAGTGTPLAPSVSTFSKTISDVVSTAVHKCRDSATLVNTAVPSTVSTSRPVFAGVVGENVAAVATAEHGNLQGLGEGNTDIRVATAPVAREAVREREEDLKLTRDRLIAQLHDRDERVGAVVYLYGGVHDSYRSTTRWIYI